MTARVDIGMAAIFGIPKRRRVTKFVLLCADTGVRLDHVDRRYAYELAQKLADSRGSAVRVCRTCAKQGLKDVAAVSPIATTASNVST